MSNFGCPDSLENQVQTTDGLSVSDAGQFVHMDDCFGFICLNKEQAFNETCFDYQIRQCCPINFTTDSPELTTIKTSPTTTSTTTSTSSTTTTPITTKTSSTTTSTTTTSTTTVTTPTTTSTTTRTTTVLPECPYNVGFENSDILTVNETEKFIELNVFADKDIDCQFRKTFIVEVELKPYTAKRGVDFDSQLFYL